MAEVERDKTTNLKLIKPKEEEFYNIQDFNSNFDKIDETIGNNTSQLKDCAKLTDLDNYYSLLNATKIATGTDILTLPFGNYV
ncbi:hypothetical protein FDF11_08345, partial [Clostridium botulinum]|nr:hypothetical protein [Clostridium botulinum]NFR13689.1 hypothetical protein [Clostridium botulinum]NFR42244.1 hypothetical protein [Clostridium botulinum]NFS50684.1 hypothetical protein [Clostridium botulinum]